MKNFLFVLSLLSLLSSCSFIRKASSDNIPSSATPQPYDGIYLNKINKKESIWSLLTKKEADTAGTVRIRSLDRKTLIVSRTNAFRTDSILVKGKLKKEQFRFRKRRKILGVFPLLWGYQSTTFSIGVDKKGTAFLDEYDYSFGGIIIPMAGSDGSRRHVLKKALQP